jgi:hypothetical protein
MTISSEIFFRPGGGAVNGNRKMVRIQEVEIFIPHRGKIFRKN